MKFLKSLLLACCMAGGVMSMSATKYVDGQSLRIVNRGWDKCLLPYSRIPAEHVLKFNETAQIMGRYSTGVGIRFATNSRSIGVKYTLLYNSHVNIQAASGTKGIDLYILDSNNRWRHLINSRPEDQKEQEAAGMMTGLDGAMHEFIMYLPLYDGVTDFKLMVDDNAVVTKGNYDAIDSSQKVVLYGTSIQQGGGATRTGMAPTCIMQRALNCEFINLAFAGAGKMETTAAQAIATIPGVTAYIIDPVPNCTDEDIKNLTIPFVKTIRDAHPGVPVFMVEGPMYSYAIPGTGHETYLKYKNELYHEAYLKLLEDNPSDLYYIDCENINGPDNDGCSDGIHLTDLGFQHYSDKVLPYLKEVVKPTELMKITSHTDGATEIPLTPTFTWSKPERDAVLEIATSASFSAQSMVYTGAGKGSHEVAPYNLASYTTYYARVRYNTTPDDPDNLSYTPTVGFTTQSVVPENPSIEFPVADGTLHANEHITIKKVEGMTSVRLEVSSSTTFGGRSGYNSTINMPEWADNKTGAEIKIGSTALVDGQTYYARVRGTYKTASGQVTTDYSEPISFKYSSQAGVDAAGVDAPEVVETVSYNLVGQPVTNPVPGSATIAVDRMSDGSSKVSKQLNR